MDELRGYGDKCLHIDEEPCPRDNPDNKWCSFATGKCIRSGAKFQLVYKDAYGRQQEKLFSSVAKNAAQQIAERNTLKGIYGSRAGDVRVRVLKNKSPAKLDRDSLLTFQVPNDGETMYGFASGSPNTIYTLKRNKGVVFRVSRGDQFINVVVGLDGKIKTGMTRPDAIAVARSEVKSFYDEQGMSDVNIEHVELAQTSPAKRSEMYSTLDDIFAPVETGAVDPATKVYNFNSKKWIKRESFRLPGAIDVELTLGDIVVKAVYNAASSDKFQRLVNEYTDLVYRIIRQSPPKRGNVLRQVVPTLSPAQKIPPRVADALVGARPRPQPIPPRRPEPGAAEAGPDMEAGGGGALRNIKPTAALQFGPVPPKPRHISPPPARPVPVFKPPVQPEAPPQPTESQMMIQMLQGMLEDQKRESQQREAALLAQLASLQATLDDMRRQMAGEADQRNPFANFSDFEQSASVAEPLDRPVAIEKPVNLEGSRRSANLMFFDSAPPPEAAPPAPVEIVDDGEMEGEAIDAIGGGDGGDVNDDEDINDSGDDEGGDAEEGVGQDRTAQMRTNIRGCLLKME